LVAAGGGALKKGPPRTPPQKLYNYGALSYLKASLAIKAITKSTSLKERPRLINRQ
jgi:hypothetical protein